ncbi:hypothetical protein COLO4_05980 [Corchorus olitorius]|uniref:Uncharacterized protein n=1 Tax=Corchorus olitorius TaxID=93759 RepID=A0A1R3KPJ3_9ROSI|nr:hypothetical protein COLO4_05980 [Corchorus olitorius]
MRSVYIRKRVEISSFRAISFPLTTLSLFCLLVNLVEGGDAELAVSHLERGKISVAILDFGYYCFEYKMSP